MIRECRVCKVEKSLTDFRRLRTGHYTRMCILCLRDQEKTNRDKAKKSEYRKTYYTQNKEREKSKVKEWVSNNRAAKSSHNRRRALRVMDLEPLSQSDWEQVLEECGRACLKCGSDNITVDHILPLFKGGTNAKNNLQPLCAPCNSAKGTQTIDYRRI